MRAAATLFPALMLGSLLMLASASPAQPASSTPRGAGPALTGAIGLARAAITACRARGSHVAALVVDADNIPVALLADDGSVPLAQVLAPRKTALVLRYRTASAAIAERAKTDAALAAEIKADPKIGFALPGAVPLMSGPTLIGALAVSGGSSPEADDACAKAALSGRTIRQR